MITNSLRRECVVMVPYHEVLNSLLPSIGVDRISVLTAKGIPPTAKVVTVYDDAPQAAFGFVIEDESFEPVAQGCLRPKLEISWEAIGLERKISTLPE